MAKHSGTSGKRPGTFTALAAVALMAVGAPAVWAGPGHVCLNGTAAPCAGAMLPTYYANSPLLRKFVDPLPLLAAPGSGLPAYIPLAVADTQTYPGSNYFVIGAVEYAAQMHADLATPTPLRGYVQLYPQGTLVTALPATAVALHYPDGAPIHWPGTTEQVWAYDAPHYLGPVIATPRGVPVRVKMMNFLPTGAAGDLKLPVDEGLGGAGHASPTERFTQNRISVHLHGGDSPWISDGHPHQWFVPAGDLTPYKRGATFANVPDMADPGEGGQTLYWPNNQSARMLWYHDHTFGLTRQNVYAGLAAGYLITDAAEDRTLGVDALETIPLVIQDKTFVPADIATQDAKWDLMHWGQPDGLWLPHVYEPNILPGGILNPAGRWDFGPTDPLALATALLPLPDGSYGNVSTTPEMYMDTPVINGKAYPTLTVDPKAYRMRFLNGSNDRYFNISLWVADASGKEVPMVAEPSPLAALTVTTGGSGYTNPVVTITDPRGSGATAKATIDPVTGAITAITLLTPGANYTAPVVSIADAGGFGSGAAAIAATLGRLGGIPDPAAAGPAVIQFATEGGLLPAPVVHRPQPIQLDAFGTVTAGGFYLANAERADTVVDFSQYAGKTLIVYNDSTAPVPAGDPRYDYYTGNADQTAVGGAPATLPGYGPNTRTLMQIVVRPNAPAAPFDPLGNGGPLVNTLPLAFQANAAVEPPVAGRVPVASLRFNSLANTLTFPDGTVAPLQVKTIEGGYDVNFGRLIANFGAELPGAVAPTPLGFIDPPTEIIEDGKPQYWRIKNHDADNHPIHFHLFNVQVIARVNPDNSLKAPLPQESGWKDVVQNWPGEELIVALKPKTPVVPFGVPNSRHLLDPTLPQGTSINNALAYPAGTAAPFAFAQYDLLTGAPKAVSNQQQDFSWEYVWHCHILGHEENDLMRPMAFKAALAAPDAPLGVSLSAGRVSWIDPTPPNTVSWNPKNEIGFRVERAAVTDGIVGAYAPIAQAGAFVSPTVNTLANATTATDPAVLPPNTDFAYRVVAVNAVGETASAPALLQQPPAAPSGLTATVTAVPTVNSVNVKLAWTDLASNESGYQVFRNGGVAPIATLAANSTGFTDTLSGLTPTTIASQSYAVRAVNGTGASASASVTVPLSVQLAAPANLAAAYTAAAGTAVRKVGLSWTDQSLAESGYVVLRATGTVNATTGAVAWSPPVRLPTATSVLAANLGSYADTGNSIALNTLYQYQVAALNGAVQGPTASAFAATMTALAAPSQLQAQGVATASTLALQWQQTASAQATGYTVQRCTGAVAVCAGANAVWKDVGSTAGVNTTKFFDAGLATKTTYTYRVRAVNSLVPTLVSPWSTGLALKTL